MLGGAGNDVLDGGAGVDYLVGGSGNDLFIVGGAELRDINGVPTLVVDTVVADSGQDAIRMDGVGEVDLQVSLGADGTVYLRNATEGVGLSGGLSSTVGQLELADTTTTVRRMVNDRLQTIVTATTQRAGAVLLGGALADALTVASADSGTTVSAGRGSDTVRINTTEGATLQMAQGDGTDTLIAAARVGAGAKNILELDPGISPVNVRLVWRANGWHVLSLGSGDGLTFEVSGWPDATSVPTDRWPIDEIRYADGSIETMADVIARGVYVLPDATPGDDIVTLTPVGDVFYGMAGNDVIDGGDGDDYLYGNEGDDTLIGGDGKDVVDGYIGTNRLEGGEGDDRYYMGYGDDTAIDAASSNDRYVVRSWLSSGNSGFRMVIADHGGSDQVDTSGWVPVSEVSVVNTGTGLELKCGDYVNSNVLVIDGAVNAGTGDVDWSRMVESIRFWDGTVWTGTDLVARSLMSTSGADRLRGYGGNDTIDGGDGDDKLYGMGGSDHLTGGAGSDQIYGGEGDDTLEGGAGNDQLYGEVGDDTLSAGPGGGFLIGGDGDDTYVVAPGDGVVKVGSAIVNNDPGHDVLRFQATRADSTVTLIYGNQYQGAGQPDTLVIATLDGSAQAHITLLGNATGADLAVDLVEFADGTVATLAELAPPQAFPALGRLVGTSLGEFIQAPGGLGVFAGMGDDVLIGTPGDDALYGGLGNDRFMPGAGADWMVLDGGANTVHLTAGQGHDFADVMRANSDPDGLIQTLLTDASMSGMPITYAWWGYDWTYASGSQVLQIAWNGGSDSLRIRTWHPEELLNLKLVLPDGSERTGTEMVDAVNAATGGNDILIDAAGRDLLDGGEGSDDLIGLNGDDRLIGGAGNDRLDGGEGDDVLIGGAGNDSLRGGTGINTIVYGIGDGADRVENATFETMRLELGAGIDPAQLSFTTLRSSNAYHFDRTILLGAGSITVDAADNFDQFWDTITFADGTIWDRSQILSAMLTGTAGNDVLGGFDDTDDVIAGGDGNDTLYGGQGSDTLSGGEGDDTLYAIGTRSSDWQDGAVDVLDGGGGNDHLYVDPATRLRFGASFGKDLVYGAWGAAVEFASVSDPEQVRVRATPSGDLVFWLPDSDDEVRLVASVTAPWVLQQVDGPVAEVSFAGATTWTWADVVARSQVGSEFDDLLLGDGFDNMLYGLAGDDQLIGGGGNDRLAGGGGFDVLSGGAGQDVFEFAAGMGVTTVTDIASHERVVVGATMSAADVTVYQDGAGNLAIRHAPLEATMILGGSSSLSGSDDLFVDFAVGTTWNLTELRTRVTSGITVGTNGNDNIGATAQSTLMLGLAGNDTMTGGSSADILDGGAGNDTMNGGLGDDIYYVDAAGDKTTESSGAGTDTVRSSMSWTLGNNLENLELLGGADINATGNSLANVLRGNAGNNVLSGGSGADTLIGGAGNDSYVVDNTGDVVTELLGEGIDSVTSSVSYTLSEHVENLTLSGSGNVNATGNGLDNVLTGNAGANVLSGGAGADTMTGGAGNDTYVVDAVGDLTLELAGGGTDLVQSSISWILADNIEKLTLTGAGAINGTGNALNNTLTGNAADNVLDGGAGNDTMVGGAGNDTYVVDNTADVITESSSSGTDTVLSSVSFTLASNVENLTLTGSANLNGTGNSLANVLRGNAGNNTLSGGTGADTLIGGAGDDIYVVDSTGDVIQENAGEGTDWVQSSVTHTLAAHVENLTLTGSSGLSGTGNSLNNVLTGNSGANTLNGGAGNDWIDGGSGNDTMVGGSGDDTFVVNATGDIVTEAVNEGTDTVRSSITLTLGNNVENLVLTGSSALNGTGNALNNVITGNSGSNTLTGAAGNDTLDGGAGTDSLVGGTGADTYLFGRGWGVDTVQENDSTGGVVDIVSFGAAIVQADTVFSRVGNNLEVVIANTADKLVVKDWYLGSQYQVEQFRYADGSTISHSQVQGLIGAMASFNSQGGYSSSQSVGWNLFREEPGFLSIE